MEPFVEAWFPNGKDDPNIGLQRVDPQTVEYWEATSPKPIRIMQHLGSAVAKKRPDVGTSGTLQIKR